MMTLEAWRRRARQLSAQTYTLYLAYRHPGTPWYAKVFAALIVGYVFSPIDPIPDFIPGVGLLDEMVVVPIGVLLAAKMIPRDVFEECREKRSEEHTSELQSRQYLVCRLLLEKKKFDHSTPHTNL